jgi:DNA-binding transcriptional LysR family regulator
VVEKFCTKADWEDLRYFVALVRHGSLSAAARTLLVNHATVARRIHSLETCLGEKLVDRRPGGYILTPAGTRALSLASDMEAAANQLGRTKSKFTPHGLIRINAPPGLTRGFLLSRLAKLSARYPDLAIDVSTNLRPVSLERHETDVAIRVGRMQDSNLIARHLVSLNYGFYATRAMCRRLATGEEPRFVGFDEKNSDIPEAAWLTRQFPSANLSFRASDFVGQATAAKAGAGVAMLPHYIAHSEPVLHAYPLSPVHPPRDVWLVKRRQDRDDPVIRLVTAYVASIFSEERNLFAVPASFGRKIDER